MDETRHTRKHTTDESVVLNQQALLEIAVGRHSQLLERLESKLSPLYEDMSDIKSSIRVLEHSVREMSKVLIESNGKSLVTKTALIEAEVLNLKHWCSQHEQKHDSEEDHSMRFRWQARVAVMSGVITFVGSLIVLGINILMRVN